MAQRTMSFCRDCQQPLIWNLVNGRNVPHNPDGNEHRMTCTAPRWARWRLRNGLIPGLYGMSVSRIQAYRDCPRLYHRRYIEHAEEPRSTAATFGTTFHQYAATRLRALKAGAEPPPRPAPSAIEEIREWDEMCGRLEAEVWDGATIYKVEEPVELRWQDGEMTVVFEGIMDLVTLDAEQTFATINDWKTGWAVEPARALFGQLQASAYALLLFKHLPTLKRVRFQQVQFRHQGRAVAATHPTIGRDFYVVEDMDAIEAALREEVGRILRDSDWLPNPACVVCPVGSHDLPQLTMLKTMTVEVANGYLEIPPLKPPKTEAEALRLALVAHAGRRIEQAARDAVRAWCAERGPVAISPDESLGFWPRIDHKCRDVVGALQILYLKGFDLSRYARIDTTAAKPLIERTSRHFLPAFHYFFDDAAATTYGFRKTRPPELLVVAGAEALESVAGAGDPTRERPALAVLEGGFEPDLDGGPGT